MTGFTTPDKKSDLTSMSCVHRVCSTDEFYSLWSADLTSKFFHRGYRREWTEVAKRKFDDTSYIQTQCLRATGNKTQPGSGPICAVKFLALGVEFRKVLYRHWKIIF